MPRPRKAPVHAQTARDPSLNSVAAVPGGAIVRLMVDRKLTPQELAEAFCELDDEAQAQFFIEAQSVSA